ncbi:cell envelope integrity EipB family protein [Roseibium sp.]|uniref:cell envelope integrity EipB family protein n=1 Tax=Roseibium sp. TaxID=1936156 RepID=UPI003B51A6B8
MMQRLFRNRAFLGGLLVIGAPVSAILSFGTVDQAAAQIAGVPLAQHRAVYDMKLADSQQQSGIAGLSGRMVYEFSGDACDGYSVNFRFVTQFQDVNGGLQVTDLQTTSFEDAGAENYQFLSKTYVDQKLVESSRGAARLESELKAIDLKEPTEKTLEIGKDVQFPTEHLMSILNAARTGGHFTASDIYDGAETGDKVFATTAVIGAKAVGEVPEIDGKRQETLDAIASWPVTVAYFDPSENDGNGEQTPVYQLSFRLFENGISDKLVLDYGDFKLAGTMTALELHDHTSQSNCSN